MQDQDKYLLTHQPCAKCGSSDGKAYFLDGGSMCYVCGVSLKVDSPDTVRQAAPKAKKRNSKLTMEEIAQLPTTDLPGRGITEAMAKAFGVKTELNQSTREHETYYFPYTINGEVVGYKARKAQSKDFFSVGQLGTKVEPFGWSRVNVKGQMIIVTEGEMDTIAATQMLKEKGKDYRVVSIANGAQAAAAFMKSNLVKFEHIDKVILNFDDDQPGIDAQKEVCTVLSPGVAFNMRLPDGFKDANDLLLNGKAYQYMEAINNSKPYKPDGIVDSLDTWDIYTNRPEVVSYAFPKEYDLLNNMTYGIRLSELDTITSGTSAGKTQWARELMYHFVTTYPELKAGILSLEEPLTDTIESYIELSLNKRISLPDVEASEEERRQGWEETFGTGRIDLYDAFGGEETSVVNNIRYLAKGKGCNIILVDHLHMLLDGKDSEKEQIERIMLTLKKLTQELGIWIGLIAHLKKSGGGATFEEGAIATLDDLKGSSSIKQLSNGVYVLSRDQQAMDMLTRNTTQITCKKCRFTGRTGLADQLYFDDKTGRMKVLPKDEVPF